MFLRFKEPDFFFENLCINNVRRKNLLNLKLGARGTVEYTKYISAEE